MSVSLLQIPQLRELEEKYARILGPGVLMERAGKAAAEFISDLYPAPARVTVVAALGITAAHPDNAYMLVACFAAVSALFVLPTYPTLLGAVQMDDTGTTRIGKWVFNHSFFIPGVLAIVFSVAFGFVACGFI